MHLSAVARAAGTQQPAQQIVTLRALQELPDQRRGDKITHHTAAKLTHQPSSHTHPHPPHSYGLILSVFVWAGSEVATYIEMVPVVPDVLKFVGMLVTGWAFWR